MSPHDTDLRDTLHRLADSAEPLPVDDDLWQRARVARRRSQAVVVAAVLAIIASVTWSAVLLGSGGEEARTASTVDGGAIPSRIEDVPDDLEPTTDLAVGRASAAFVSANGEPVVVTASDGVPHVLDLGAWGPDRAAYALSPDGRLLAVQQPASDDTRLRVLDLATGNSTDLRVADEQLEVDGIGWSPDSTEVGWVASAVGSRPPMVGRASTDGTDARTVAPPSNTSSVAIADDGSAALGRVDGRLFLWGAASDLTPLAIAPTAGVGAFSPDGRHLALATGPDTSSYTLDLRSERVARHPFPAGTFGESVVRPMGWLDDRLQLLLVQPIDGSDAELVVTTPRVDGSSTWRRSVASVATVGVASSLSLAVDLVPDLDGTSSQQLTHDFGDAPADPERDISWMIGLGVAAAIAVLMALRSLWRRLTS